MASRCRLLLRADGVARENSERLLHQQEPRLYWGR